jgi:cysteine desulfurase
VASLKAQFIRELASRVALTILGDPAQASPYILCFAIPGINADALINQTASAIAIASGSACSSGTIDPSSVLRAMGIEGDLLYGAVRISFDPAHTPADIRVAVAAISAAVERIQAAS